MFIESAFFTAFVIGFLGSAHCVPMCGGIVGILSQQADNAKHHAVDKTLAYNTGRILSYSFIGLLAGGFSQLALLPLDTQSLLIFSRVFTAIFMFAFGFYLLGKLNFISHLEKLGQRLWKHISPLSRSLLPIKNKKSAFYLGLIWGWLPCGLVYSAVAWSLASASFINGALIMLCFGLGTLPMLLTMGFASEKLTRLKNSTTTRRVAGVLIIAFAIGHLFSLNNLHQHPL